MVSAHVTPVFIILTGNIFTREQLRSVQLARMSLSLFITWIQTKISIQWKHLKRCKLIIVYYKKKKQLHEWEQCKWNDNESSGKTGDYSLILSSVLFNGMQISRKFSFRSVKLSHSMQMVRETMTPSKFLMKSCSNFGFAAVELEASSFVGWNNEIVVKKCYEARSQKSTSSFNFDFFFLHQGDFLAVGLGLDVSTDFVTTGSGFLPTNWVEASRIMSNRQTSNSWASCCWWLSNEGFRSLRKQSGFKSFLATKYILNLVGQFIFIESQMAKKSVFSQKCTFT